ncbi:regulator of sigma D [Yersinia rohdei]|uniref:Regulator of sigma D n=1 Tax=Yersinia rohdei TaxID=29485 RepID=A0A0U1HY42_YERRO|nr:Rsd/AlgQ family anti-sigma factor [Yersinia rohdei]AJJ10649.1 regulator of sigma D [Yersinia rohdei]EEQ01245.1 Regulator of sigma D [Yersinia rohdei ATCC 43380]MDN0096404.1 Rsd/AlgQ family anti-sigma factor [Yersinia rohdei]OWF76812.1 sigma D regulator [Yersinia rohdei]CNF42776.1 anti-RNA polymerase sigma 70 factor [Yersinia rohdei]
MLNRLENLTQRVGGSNELIDQWLHARKELLVSYCAVIGIKPQKEKHTPLNGKALENFCHNLVDYLSSGHFQIYDRIIKQVEGASSPKMTLTTKFYPALQNNTQTIMAFHDSYTNIEIDDDNCTEFQQALSDIGESLDARFKLEDQLIQWAAESWQAAQQVDLQTKTN